MPDLHPTPTRLALLRDVAAGRILQTGVGDSEDVSGRRVTARMVEMETARWAYPDPNGWHTVRDPNGVTYSRTRWRLTDAGRAVLDAHPEVRRA